MQRDTHVAVPYNLRVNPLHFIHPVLPMLKLRPSAAGTMPGTQYRFRRAVRVCIPTTRRARVGGLIVSDPVGLTIRLVNDIERGAIAAEARKGRWFPSHSGLRGGPPELVQIGCPGYRGPSSSRC